MSQTEKVLQDFYQQEAAILTSLQKRVTREKLLRQAKAATQQAVLQYERRQQQAHAGEAAYRKTKKGQKEKEGPLPASRIGRYLPWQPRPQAPAWQKPRRRL
ncbi:hypothetical protein MTO96_035736 [Rhipicephalus appendiculatus]